MARTHVSESESGEQTISPANLTQRVAQAVIGAVVLVLLWSRLAVLGTSFWHDETVTAFFYVDRGPRGIFFGHYVPNNHVLFSLLSWATTGIVGHFEASYRIWSVLPALVSVAVIGWWAWRRFGPLTAVAVLIFATVAPLHLVLAPQARGYGLGFLAGAGMLVGAARAADSGSVSDVVVFAAFGLVGIWTFVRDVQERTSKVEIARRTIREINGRNSRRN